MILIKLIERFNIPDWLYAGIPIFILLGGSSILLWPLIQLLIGTGLEIFYGISDEGFRDFLVISFFTTLSILILNIVLDILLPRKLLLEYLDHKDSKAEKRFRIQEFTKEAEKLLNN